MAVIEFWDKIEAQNRQRLGENVLMSITQDNSGSITIQSESPVTAVA